MYSLIFRDKLWEQVGETYRSATSPASDKDGNVFFSDPVSNRIYKSDPARGVSVFKENTHGAHTLRVGADGRLHSIKPAFFTGVKPVYRLRTKAGYELLVASAPGHVAKVRSLVMDALSSAELRHLHHTCERLLASVESSD